MIKTLDNIANLISRGQLELAIAAAAQARTRFPHAGEPARLHGVALLGMGRVTDAIGAFDAARSLDPRSIETLCNLGSARLAEGNGHAAVDILESARSLAPAHPAVLNGLGNAFAAIREPVRSRDAYAAATRAAPGYVGAWINLAAAELALGHPVESERVLRMVLARSAHPEAQLVLGNSLAAQQRHAEAEQAYAAGAQMLPEDARFPYQVGIVAEEQNHPVEAAAAFQRALALDPTMTAALAQLVFIQRQLCDWRDLERHSMRLREAVAAGAPGVPPFGVLAEDTTAAEQLHAARTFARSFAVTPSSFAHRPRATDAVLRVGFVSNGFGNHPTGLLTVAMFEALHASGIEIHLFATAREDGQAIEQRLRRAAHSWHALHGHSARAMAERMHASGVEILLDLRVWGGGNVAAAFALRPAPLQINWLAYPGTSGAPWIDYVIADRTVLPADMRVHFSEHVAWLPRCFQPSDPTRVVAEPPSLAACGLPDNATVYVCFNNSYKLNARSVVRMLAVLRAVEHSVLWLLSGPGTADASLRAIAEQHGVDPTRLVFMSKLPHEDYLARYRHADLFLDTTPYNAHTTASDAIWAGCPVLTVAGDTFAARVAASLNHHLGMPELNAADDAAFVEFAVHIGRDRAVRNALHARIAERRVHSGLFDMQAFANDFAALLRAMSARHRAGLAPASIDDVAAQR